MTKKTPARSMAGRIESYKRKEDGARVRERKLTLVEQTVRELDAEHGCVSATLLLRTITPEAHPLHDRLTWDDSVAAHKHRLRECAEMIASVMMIASRRVPDPPSLTVVLPDSPCVRAYVSAFRGEPLMLRTTALSDEARRAVIVERKAGELRSWLRESIDIDELASIRSAIQSALAEHGF